MCSDYFKGKHNLIFLLYTYCRNIYPKGRSIMKMYRVVPQTKSGNKFDTMAAVLYCETMCLLLPGYTRYKSWWYVDSGDSIYRCITTERIYNSLSSLLCQAEHHLSVSYSLQTPCAEFNIGPPPKYHFFLYKKPCIFVHIFSWSTIG